MGIVQAGPPESKQEALLEILSVEPRLNTGKACRMIGIAPSTLQSWRKLYPNFRERLNRILEDATSDIADQAEDKLVDLAIQKADLGAIKIILSAHKPKTYAKQAAPAVTVNNYSLVLVPRGAPESNQAVRAIDVTPEPLEIDAAEDGETVW